MKKQIIRLTESDLHNIIKESVNKILNESGRFNDWRDAYDAYMNHSGLDDDSRREGERLRKEFTRQANLAYGGDPNKSTFNGDKRFFKDLDKHSKFRDSQRNYELSKTKSGRDYLDWEDKWEREYNRNNGISDDDFTEVEPKKERPIMRNPEFTQKKKENIPSIDGPTLSSDELNSRIEKMKQSGMLK